MAKISNHVDEQVWKLGYQWILGFVPQFSERKKPLTVI